MNWEQLNNPVWYALWQVQDKCAAIFPYLQGYLPEYANFAASLEPNKVANSLEIYSQLIPRFYFVGDQPQIPASLSIKNELVCDQMVLRESSSFMLNDHKIIKLENIHIPQIVNLISQVLPGFVQVKTPMLGDFYGIFYKDKLVSVAGERMQTNDFIEVSGCVTQSEFRNKGYQTDLIKKVVNGILMKGKTPFLHVASNNFKAISVYQKLGFEFRRKISFWEIQ